MLHFGLGHYTFSSRRHFVRYLLQQLALPRRAERWLWKLMEFDVKCIMQKAVNGQTIVELLAKHSVLSLEKKEEAHFNEDDEQVK